MRKFDKFMRDKKVEGCLLMDKLEETTLKLEPVRLLWKWEPFFSGGFQAQQLWSA